MQLVINKFVVFAIALITLTTLGCGDGTVVGGTNSGGGNGTTNGGGSIDSGASAAAQDAAAVDYPLTAATNSYYDENTIGGSLTSFDAGIEADLVSAELLLAKFIAGQILGHAAKNKFVTKVQTQHDTFNAFKQPNILSTSSSKCDPSGDQSYSVHSGSNGNPSIRFNASLCANGRKAVPVTYEELWTKNGDAVVIQASTEQLVNAECVKKYISHSSYQLGDELVIEKSESGARSGCGVMQAASWLAINQAFTWRSAAGIDTLEVEITNYCVEGVCGTVSGSGVSNAAGDGLRSGTFLIKDGGQVSYKLVVDQGRIVIHDRNDVNLAHFFDANAFEFGPYSTQITAYDFSKDLDVFYAGAIDGETLSALDSGIDPNNLQANQQVINEIGLTLGYASSRQTIADEVQAVKDRAQSIYTRTSASDRNSITSQVCDHAGTEIKENQLLSTSDVGQIRSYKDCSYLPDNADPLWLVSAHEQELTNYDATALSHSFENYSARDKGACTQLSRYRYLLTTTATSLISNYSGSSHDSGCTPSAGTNNAVLTELYDGLLSSWTQNNDRWDLEIVYNNYCTNGFCAKIQGQGLGRADDSGLESGVFTLLSSAGVEVASFRVVEGMLVLHDRNGVSLNLTPDLNRRILVPSN